MTKISNLGYPRLGEKREWKKLIEGYWNKTIRQNELFEETTKLRKEFLKKQFDAGVDFIPVGDFSLYDQILDLSIQFNIIPKRFSDRKVDIDLFFDIARGNKKHVASALKKWFNTNYHYIVPEWDNAQPKLNNTRLLDLYKEAREIVGNKAKPVITGPITFIALSSGVSDFKDALNKLVPLYTKVFKELVTAGATYIQIDEPIFVTDEGKNYIEYAYEVYNHFNKNINATLIFQTYFEALVSSEKLIDLPVAFGLDFVHGLEENLSYIESGLFKNKTVFAGVVDGRNIWSNNFETTEKLLKILKDNVKELIIQPSSSLLHVPVTAKNETELDKTLLNGLAFADEKLTELKLLAEKLDEITNPDYNNHIENYKKLQQADFRNLELESINNIRSTRLSNYAVRRVVQAKRFNFPLLPTTTIGSFPQSKKVRLQRALWKKGELSDTDYEKFIKEEIARWIKIQENLDLDVFVHGEFERTDMVEFFGQRFAGFASTKFGWVQSYGSRGVKPPIIYGDVKHIQAVTVKETAYAQSLTNHPVKGMLTGPITILNWSFERTDIPKAEIFNQIAIALKNEINLLEKAGISVIQVDEPALREGLPLRNNKKTKYLEEAVFAFRLATSSVKDDTQIHTHMCYSNFDEIIDSIRALDADVISIETSRSHGELISAFETAIYPLGIGLGVYDIHSPRIPTKEEIRHNILRPLQKLSKEQFWINPDCGLKTRDEKETIEALKILVETTKEIRQELSDK
ncbi:5-methyltetrahydropteroyltriglutamate--homocysteine methyltransferase [Gemella sp. oral taxon 928]|uniref:5-methyltetrahydropteroyltriglutamate-- homocysteine S-methyltransferase n=1 Tax=unclassified Gemella TaxID=2624949 RepID=UPI00076829C2|nr:MULTISPECIES: 5-methyltetrahydropteroyltriglutamate--homocysteine S-methyltransferase [unclassified Gemella]AME08966.1 5-methyltetrahydropteroyltriglutamate--homocysteine methyltransferase [Gemella sp. oral taxon 928]AXI26535.1 5-methyltetrahydropteroyltriglutamate--homocysteine S-methyltransferase [Gemella sp. ND 6198]